VVHLSETSACVMKLNTNTSRKLPRILGNFINIGKTVATRHQRYMCYKMTCSTNFLGEDTAFGTGIQVHTCNSLYCITLLTLATSITVNNVKYRSDLYNTHCKGTYT